MEQQDSRGSTISQPSSPETNHVPQQKKHNSPADNLPTQAAFESSKLEESGSSEPSLRFPRPVGSTHLAHWISSSTPDIMRTTPVSAPCGPDGEANLEDSTYEYIQTDSEWSQDGATTESMSDSDSTDLHQRSLDDQGDHDDSLEPVVVLGYGDHESDIDGREEAGTVGPESSVQTIKANAHTHQDDEDTAASRSSLDYARKSLRSPSLSSPPVGTDKEDEGEAINALRYQDRMYRMDHLLHTTDEAGDRPAGSKKSSVNKWISGQASGLSHDQHKRSVVAGISITFFWAAVMALITIFAASEYGWISSLSVPANSTPATVTYTVTTSAPLATLAPIPDKTEGKALLVFSPSNLLPVPRSQDCKRTEPESYEPRFHPTMSNVVQILAPRDTLSRWSGNRCLHITASRDGQDVPLSFQITDKVAIKFDNRDAFGVVDIFMEATCRPKVRKVIKVHFNRGFVQDVLELTKEFAHNVTELVPAAAQEAERRIGHARHSWDNMTNTVSSKIAALSNRVATDLTTTFENAYESAKGARNDLSRRVENYVVKVKDSVDQVSNSFSKTTVQQANNVRDVQSQLKLHLLSAQLKARALYLKALGRPTAQEYERKGKEYLATMKARVKAASVARHEKAPLKDSKALLGISWAKYLGLDRDERDVVHLRKDRSQA